MIVEHAIILNKGKSPLEEDDIPSSEMRYIVTRANAEDVSWQEEENSNMSNPMSNSTMISSMHEFEPLLSQFKTTIKSELMDELPVVQTNNNNNGLHGDEVSYQEFKNQYLRSIDGITFKCIPCNRTIIKTSICAHLRLWHATKMMFNCELCSDGFRRHDYRQRHMATSHPNELFCDKCQHQFYRTGMYLDHMWNSHKTRINLREKKPKDEVDVPLEIMTFAPKVPEFERMHPTQEKPGGRKRRLSIDRDESPINPAAGGLTYFEFRNLYVRDDTDFMTCIPCNEKLSKLSLKKHMKKFHATSRPFNCELCDESFQRLEERMKHMQSFHPNSFNCKICVLQFYYSSDYKDHMKMEHNQNISINTTKVKSDIDVPIERLRFLPRASSEIPKIIKVVKATKAIGLKVKKIIV